MGAALSRFRAHGTADCPGGSRAEQQAFLSLHRLRQGFIEERTALINRLRAVLTEFGVVLPNRTQWVRRDAVAVAEPLPVLARQAVEDLRAHLTQLDERIGAYDRQLEQPARANERGQG